MHSIAMPEAPEVLLSVHDLFGIDSDMQVRAIMYRISTQGIILTRK